MNRPPDIGPALWSRVEALSPNGDEIEEFGFFLDTHRDLPHIGSFDDDLHRGICAPTLVSYNPVLDSYRNEKGILLERHAKHQFLDPGWYAEFTIQKMMNGEEPLDKDGRMPTSHLRDARLKVYHIWSFRQVVMDHYHKMSSKP